MNLNPIDASKKPLAYLVLECMIFVIEYKIAIELTSTIVFLYFVFISYGKTLVSLL